MPPPYTPLANSSSILQTKRHRAVTVLFSQINPQQPRKDLTHSKSRGKTKPVEQTRFAALIHVGSELAFILNSARLFRSGESEQLN
jgi:hypothetical protein